MGNCCRSTGARRWRSTSLERGSYPLSGAVDVESVELPSHEVSVSQSSTGLFLLSCEEWEESFYRTSIHIPELELPEVSNPAGLVLPLQSWLAVTRPQLWASSEAYVYKSFDVTSKATTIDWEGYGLKIQILDNSIPHYLTTVSLDVNLHYINNHPYLPVPPGDHTPFSCSALYCIKVGSGKLCKPVTIEIQHCSNSEPEQLTFLRAPSEGEYFRPVTDAIFDKRTNCGRVIAPKLDLAVQDQEYSDFSWFIITMRRLFLRNTIHYKAQVYISKVTTVMHFIVTMALDLCSTVVKEKYDEYDLHTSFPVQFDRGSNKIVLNVPEEGTLDNGWMIKPLYYPSITKRLVDQFCIFHNNIPKCEFSLQCKQSPPARLSHKITLTGGTANEKSHFSIDFVPPCSIVQTSCHGQLNEHTVDKYLHTIPSKELVRLGLELGLRYPKLKELESTETFCLNLISAWLREEDEVSERSGKPSWESLAKALEEIGQKGMARSIRDTVIANDH